MLDFQDTSIAEASLSNHATIPSQATNSSYSSDTIPNSGTVPSSFLPNPLPDTVIETENNPLGCLILLLIKFQPLICLLLLLLNFLLLTSISLRSYQVLQSPEVTLKLVNLPSGLKLWILS